MTSSKLNPKPKNQSLLSITPQEAVRLKVICISTAPLSQMGQLSPASLAYIGDAVYELYVRSVYLLPPRRLSDYHSQVVAQVRAEQQAAHLQTLEPYLTETEQEIVRQGRNAATGRPRRLSPKLYQQATSLETLIGYLYLQDPQRLTQLLEYLEL
ncbi:ribonuclease III [Gloeothece citriformis PCC 7424]|uniref:Mini-ribonuclease 3 n=2 Tax=Gloeothece TaxID=28070 RepID=B7KCP4_GLOC7|nr:ribonuclease III [Gloeothece citriformis PCC 7424]